MPSRKRKETLNRLFPVPCPLPPVPFLMPFPRITLVTPSFNQGQFLEQTILSVLEQNYPDLEYIIMDGGSNDNSVEIIKQYEKHLTYWQSKPDKGQSDALCQGFARATGTLMNWVNSDDLLAPGALAHMASLHHANPDADILAAATEHFTANPANSFDKIIPRNWCPAAFLHVIPRDSFSFNQQGVFFTRNLFNQVGGLNPSLHVCMDYDLFLRMCETNPEIIYSPQTAAYFRFHAASKTTSGSARFLIREHAELLQIYNESFQRTGLVANRLRDVNRLHWLLFRSIWRADLSSMKFAYQALKHSDHRSAPEISAKIAILFCRRIFLGLRV